MMVSLKRMTLKEQKKWLKEPNSCFCCGGGWFFFVWEGGCNWNCTIIILLILDMQ
jgi:hypothetical protein